MGVNQRGKGRGIGAVGSRRTQRQVLQERFRQDPTAHKLQLHSKALDSEDADVRQLYTRAMSTSDGVSSTAVLDAISQLELDVDPGEACRLLSLIVDWALNKGYVYFFNIFRDLYYRTLDGSFSAIPRPIFASN